MELCQTRYKAYLQILHEELVPALGCTEPIAIAYASAKARELLGEFPDHITAACSGNIVKNVKGVIVPTTGDLRGIEASAILGAVAGRPEKELEVLCEATPKDIEATRAYIKQGMCTTQLLEHGASLHLIITAQKDGHSACVEIQDTHTNITHMEKDGQVLFHKKASGAAEQEQEADRSCLNIADIYTFANEVRMADVEELLQRQIDFNVEIAREGLEHPYGASVGSTLLKCYGDDVKNLAKAYAAAGSDARMSGCVMPVIINSGSGNQGMAASLPVIQYARHLGSSREELCRALVLSNLVAIHQKTGIGRLSAYCGAVSAAVGSGAAITYLHGGTYDMICDTITNTLANVSGIVCDGAKPSCAAKIASAVDAAILGHCMSLHHHGFQPGEGIVKKNVEATIRGVGRIGKDGMRETDAEILKLMLEDA